MDVVTGAFGYTGRFITMRLLRSASVARTLTNHADRPNPFGDRVEVAPLTFDDRRALVASLRGADVLCNTYWIRFSRGDTTFDRAVENTRLLVEAAVEAGVRRIVHLSITNPDSSSLPYFTGKARAEQLVMESSLPYGIVRPTVLFGGDGILINNIAWLLRRFRRSPSPARVSTGSDRFTWTMSLQSPWQPVARTTMWSSMRSDRRHTVSRSRCA